MLSPLTIDGVLYADGGITNNFPVEPLLGKCDKIIGIYSNPLKKLKAEDVTSSMSVMERAVTIGIASMSTRKFPDCDLVISPKKLSKLGTFSMSSMDEAYRIGYEEGKARIKEWICQ